MFLDERIIIQRGKIFRKLNIIAIVFAFVYLVCRMYIYSLVKAQSNFGLYSTEICTIVCAVIILLIGELYYKTNIDDERVLTNKYTFYSKNGKTLLFAIIIGYAISMIFYDNRSNYDFETNNIIIMFELVFVVYLYYQFKKNDININYSFIDKTNSQYYLDVLKNIGIFALVTGLIYTIVGVISTVIAGSGEVLVGFLIAAVISIIILGSHYFLLSVIEKVDYDDLLNEIKNSIKIITIIVFILSMIYCVASIIYRNLTLENISGSTDKIAIVSVIMHNIKIFALTYIGIYCAYLLSYFKYDTSVNKGIALYIKGIIAITIITVILSTVKNISVYNLTLDVYAERMHALKTLKRVLLVSNILEVILILLYGYFILTLVRDKKYSFYLILLPVFLLISFILVLTVTDTKEYIIKCINALYEIIKVCQWSILSIVLIKEIKYYN